MQGRIAGGSDVVERVARLLPERRDHREDAREEGAPIRAPGPEAPLAPDDRMPRRALGDVVRWLDAFLAHEGEERRFALEDVAARSAGLRIRAALAVPEHVADGPLHRPHPALEVLLAERAVANPVPPPEHLLRVPEPHHADAARVGAPATSTAGATATLTVCSILLIEPSPTFTPQKSASRSCTDRLDIRNLPVQMATLAVRRGPKAQAGTPAGSSARVRAPQSHPSSASWYSVTCGFTGGRSTTWAASRRLLLESLDAGWVRGRRLGGVL